MSQENVELALLMTDAWNRRDVEGVIELWDPEGVFYPAFEMPEGRTYRSPAEPREYFAGLAEFSEESRAEYTEVHDLGDQVLGLGGVWFRFAGGVELDQEAGGLWTWRDGKCVEARAWIGPRRSHRCPRSRRAFGVGRATF
jgi:ketosteroid isomerase-like protein